MIVTYLHRIFCAVFILLVLMSLPACQRESTTGLGGTLLFENRPVDGASIEIYLKSEKDRSTAPSLPGCARLWTTAGRGC